MCAAEVGPERRYSQSVHGSPSLPRTFIPPIAATSLPCSPLLSSTNPDSWHRRPSAHPPHLFHPTPMPSPHQIAPPSFVLAGDAPEPEVYAKAYEMLKLRWEGTEREIMSADSNERASRKRRFSSKSSSGTSRRDSVFPQEQVKEEREAEEEEVEEAANPLKRTKSSRDNSISFFDNPPPAQSQFDEEGFRRPSLPTPRRSQSLSPRLPSCSQMSSSRSSSNSHNRRKRSVSQPCHSIPPLSSITNSTPLPSLPHRSLFIFTSPSPFASLPHSQSAPQLAPPTSTTRSEALLHVVKSFEAVLACRAEGWRRLASRKTSWNASNSTTL